MKLLGLTLFSAILCCVGCSQGSEPENVGSEYAGLSSPRSGSTRIDPDSKTCPTKATMLDPELNCGSTVHDPKTLTAWDRVMLDAEWIKKGFLGPYMPEVLEAASRANVSGECLNGIKEFSRGLDNWERWAIKMADASSKVPSGLLSGTYMDFGGFDECLALSSRYCLVGHASPLIDSTRRDRIHDYEMRHGRPPPWIADYLNINPLIERNRTLYLGVCLPSGCLEEDFYKLFHTVSSPLGLDVSISVCEVDETKEFSHSGRLALYSIAFVILLCVVGSHYNSHFPTATKKEAESEGLAVRCLRAFSFSARLEDLHAQCDRKSSLDSFHGMRLFACLTMALGHTFMFPDHYYLMRLSHYNDFREQFPFLIRVYLENGTILLDIFFVSSGFLLLYSLWGKLEKNGGKLNLPRFFLHRALRIYPSLLVTVAILMIVPPLSSAPTWTNTWGEEVQKCETSLWRNILFISNFQPVTEECLAHTWFLSCLMQCHAIGVVVLLVVFKWRKLGILMGLAVSFGCIYFSYVTALARGITLPAPFRLNEVWSVLEYGNQHHVRPFLHAPPYLIGMVTGYIALKHKSWTQSGWVRLLCWILALAISTFSLACLSYIEIEGHQAALYIATYRTLFALPVAWTFYACATGHGGVLHSVLSRRPLVMLSSLSFLVYLLHPLLLLYRRASAKERYYFGNVEHGYDYVAVMTMCFAASYLLHACVEGPFGVVESLLVGSETGTLVKTSKVDTNEKKSE